MEPLAASLASIVRLIRTQIPGELISSRWMGEIEGVAARLPSAPIRFWGFECRLGEHEPSADLLVSITVDDGGRDALAVEGLDWLAAKAERARPWQRVLDFCKLWLDPGSSLLEGVAGIWLEFDVNGAAFDESEPNLFFAPRSGSRSSCHEDGGCFVADVALPVLLGVRATVAQERQLRLCFECLPEEAQVFQIGVMLARPSGAVRLCISGLSPNGLLAYLRAIGWAGPAGELRRLLDGLQPFADSFVLAIDMGEALSPRIGLECYVDGFRQPRVEPRWRALLDSLVSRGLCTPGKRDGVLAWPAVFQDSDMLADWPENLRLVSEFLGRRAASLFLCSLHHLKITFEPERPLEAKAYLGVAHLWRSAPITGVRDEEKADAGR